jgi:hypothetical protein
MRSGLPSSAWRVMRFLLRSLGLAVILFAIGALARVPAARIQEVYGAHALIVALPYAMAVSLFVRKTNAAAPVPAALGACAALLGSMAPIMGLAFFIPALVCAAAAALPLEGSHRAEVMGSCAGASFYPAILAAGAITGAHAIAVQEIPRVVLIALALAIGCIAVSLICSRAAGWIKDRQAVRSGTKEEP